MDRLLQQNRQVKERISPELSFPVGITGYF